MAGLPKAIRRRNAWRRCRRLMRKYVEPGWRRRRRRRKRRIRIEDMK